MQTLDIEFDRVIHTDRCTQVMRLMIHTTRQIGDNLNVINRHVANQTGLGNRHATTQLLMERCGQNCKTV